MLKENSLFYKGRKDFSFRAREVGGGGTQNADPRALKALVDLDARRSTDHPFGNTVESVASFHTETLTTVGVLTSV